MNASKLKSIAYDLVASKISAKQNVTIQFAVTELINSFDDVQGDDSGLYHFCAREYCYKIVKSVVDKYEAKSNQELNSNQLVLGFAHLQVAYSFNVDGERTLIHIDKIPSALLLERASEYKAQAETLLDHAEEIEDFVENRGKTTPQGNLAAGSGEVT